MGAAARRRRRPARPAPAARDPPRERRPARPSQRALRRVHGRWCASGWATPSCRPSEIFATEDDFARRGRRVARPLRGRRGRGVRRPAPARARRRPRSSGCSSTAPARGRGHARALLAELERLAADDGCERVRLYTTEVLREARALYSACGYRPVGVAAIDGRIDLWLEKAITPHDADEQARAPSPAPRGRRAVGSPCGHARHQSSDRAGAGGDRLRRRRRVGRGDRAAAGRRRLRGRDMRPRAARRDPRCTPSSTSSIAMRSAPSSRASRPSSDRRAWSSPPPASSARDRARPSRRRTGGASSTSTSRAPGTSSRRRCRACSRGAAGASSRSPRRSASPASSATRPTRHPRAA